MSNFRPLTLNELLFREPTKIEIAVEQFKEETILAKEASKALPSDLEQLKLTAAPAMTPSTSIALLQFIKRNRFAIILTTSIIIILAATYQNEKRKAKKLSDR